MIVDFTQKNFKEKLYSDPEFYNVFVSVCLNYLKDELLAAHERIKKNNETKLKIVAKIKSMNLLPFP